MGHLSLAALSASGHRSPVHRGHQDHNQPRRHHALSLIVLVSLVGFGIKAAGAFHPSSTVQKILFNFLQVSAIALHFPLQWPPAVETMFEGMAAFSTVIDQLVNPDCLSKSSTAADLFYIKQIMFATAPFLASIVAFIYWYLKGMYDGNNFFAKRSERFPTTSKDKYVATVVTIVYLIFPTLCSNTFKIFHCRNLVYGVGQQWYLAAAMEEPCYEGRHLVMALTLGVSQLLIFVLGIPLLVLILLRHNKKLNDGEGLTKFSTKIRYGALYGAYKESRYYWEIVVTERKVFVVAVSVFGPTIGTGRQALLSLAVLLICICLEIVFNPFDWVDDVRNFSLLCSILFILLTDL